MKYTIWYEQAGKVAAQNTTTRPVWVEMCGRLAILVDGQYLWQEIVTDVVDRYGNSITIRRDI